jgi:hypothetical protein
MLIESSPQETFVGLYGLINTQVQYLEGQFVLIDEASIPRNFPYTSHYIPVTESEREECMNDSAKFFLRGKNSDGFVITYPERGYSVLSTTKLNHLQRVLNVN